MMRNAAIASAAVALASSLSPTGSGGGGGNVIGVGAAATAAFAIPPRHSSASAAGAVSAVRGCSASGSTGCTGTIGNCRSGNNNNGCWGRRRGPMDLALPSSGRLPSVDFDDRPYYGRGKPWRRGGGLAMSSSSIETESSSASEAVNGADADAALASFEGANGSIPAPPRTTGVNGEKKEVGAGGVVEVGTSPPTDGGELDFPTLGEGGIWHIENKEQHANFLAAHPEDLVVMKFYAPWCRACKALAPKFMAVANDPTYTEDLPVVFAELNIKHNKEFVKSLGILALPSVHFYAGSDGLVENFPCGPSKVPILKRKLAAFLNENIDPETRELKLKVDCTDPALMETEPCRTRRLVSAGAAIAEGEAEATAKVGDVTLTDEQLRVLRRGVPYFRDLAADEFDTLLSKATLQTFEPGSVIMRQGMEGEAFYVIESGEVETLVKTAFEDPLTTPGTYLGAEVNRFGPNEYFGERALITGEPRAASIRAVEKTRCFTFNKDDIPASSVLSGKKTATSSRLRQIDDKYGVDVYDIDLLDEQFKTASMANQARGSLNTPMPIAGVDTDDDDVEVSTEEGAAVLDGPVAAGGARMDIFPLLVRFKMIRQVSRCFEYIMRTKPKWGDVGEINRRNMLVSQLTGAQKQEFRDVFRMIDTTKDGRISILELKRSMESAEIERTEDELRDMINKANPAVDGNTEITLDEFMGVMAEAEFYYLFTDTFNALDKHNSGFVRAADLDRVLCGMRDLISDDRHSIIDVEDKEMQVDYEQFSKMLLGATL